MRYVYAVDIGGTFIKYSFFQEDGTLLEKWQRPTNPKHAVSPVLADIALVILDHMDAANLSKEQIVGIGMGIPGVVDASEQVLVAPNLDWHNVDVRTRLSGLVQIPVYLLNDANAAALGESVYGGGKGYASMVLMTLGTGVGGGVVLNGRVITGFGGAAGELGHLCVNEQETIPCNCGLYGCLEQYASATGIVNSYRTATNQGISGTLSLDQPITAKDVVEAYQAGDEAAKHALDRFGYYMGKACAMIACVISPEVVVLGGGVSAAGELLLPLVEQYYQQFAFSACRGTKFVLATLGNDAGMYGCAAHVLGHL